MAAKFQDIQSVHIMGFLQLQAWKVLMESFTFGNYPRNKIGDPHLRWLQGAWPPQPLRLSFDLPPLHELRQSRQPRIKIWMHPHRYKFSLSVYIYIRCIYIYIVLLWYYYVFIGDGVKDVCFYIYIYIYILHMHTNVHPDASMYSEALRFQDRPDYAYLRRLFKELFSKEGGWVEAVDGCGRMPGNMLIKVY